MGMKEFTRLFNERFPNTPRIQTGLSGLVDRLRGKYKKFNGHMEPQPGDKRPHEGDSDEEGGNDHGFDGTHDSKADGDELSDVYDWSDSWAEGDD